MQFCHQRTTFLALNLQFAYFVWSKMSVKGIIMFLGMNNTSLERKILIILDFENGFLPTYLPQCDLCSDSFHALLAWSCGRAKGQCCTATVTVAVYNEIHLHLILERIHREVEICIFQDCCHLQELAFPQRPAYILKWKNV